MERIFFLKKNPPGIGPRRYPWIMAINCGGKMKALSPSKRAIIFQIAGRDAVATALPAFKTAVIAVDGLQVDRGADVGHIKKARAHWPFRMAIVQPPLLQTNMFWHRRFGQDAGNLWLRALFAAKFGK